MRNLEPNCNMKCSYSSFRFPPEADSETEIWMEVLDLGGDCRKYQQGSGEGRNQWCYQASWHDRQVKSNLWWTLDNSIEHTSQKHLNFRVGSWGIYPPTPALGRGLFPKMRVFHFPAASGYLAKKDAMLSLIPKDNFFLGYKFEISAPPPLP